MSSDPKPADVGVDPVDAVEPTTTTAKTDAEPATEPQPAAEPVPAEPAAAESAPSTEPVAAAAEPEPTPAPVAKAEQPLTLVEQFFKLVPEVTAQAAHPEMWGITLSSDPSDAKTSVVLYKFLKANGNDLAKAQTQLVDALAWRKKVQPRKLLQEKAFDPKFAPLGFVTTYDVPAGKEIITWNIYGAVKDLKQTFANVDEFIEWRAALMELSVAELNLEAITEPIADGATDPYRMIQVHDYLNVKFLRADPTVKAASKETIRVLSLAYPELVKEKFFVNVPLIMGWMFQAMKLFVSAETIKKFHPLSYGSSLAKETPGIGEQLPKAYGGKGPDVTAGLTVKYETVVESKETAADAEPATAATKTEAPVPAADAVAEAEAPLPVDAEVKAVDTAAPEPATETAAA